ncbi:MAG TPA: T9SS type A sorting domain-containing protein [Ignavibacteria bacterium]
MLNNSAPVSYYIKQNYPNPFNPITKLEFGIKKSGTVKIIIYDLLGREAATLVNEKLAPGTYEAEFDRTNYPSGMYFYRLVTEYYNDTKKMVLIK